MSECCPVGWGGGAGVMLQRGRREERSAAVQTQSSSV